MLPNPTNSIWSAWSGNFWRKAVPVSSTHFWRSGWPQGIQNVTTLAPAGIVGVAATGVPPATPAAALVWAVAPGAGWAAPAAAAGCVAPAAGAPAAAAGLV